MGVLQNLTRTIKIPNGRNNNRAHFLSVFDLSLAPEGRNKRNKADNQVRKQKSQA
jgi:hypothetical protein